MTEICIVPGHAALGGEDPRLESNWLLESFQQDGGHHLTCFRSHIKAGLAWLESNPQGWLVPSGGRTRPGCRLSEASSYMELARAYGLITYPPALARVLLEVYARDSFENVLLSIAAAFSQTQTRLTRVVTIGFAFKAQRFHDHFAMLDLGPQTSFEYFGLNNPVEPNLTAALASEASTRAAFRSTAPDQQAVLRRKRASRSWNGRKLPYAHDCRAWPELHRALIDWDRENP